LAERQPSKLHVASSNLVSRSTDSSSGLLAGAPERLAAAGLRLRAASARAIRLDPDLSAAAASLSAGYRAGSPPSQRAGSLPPRERTGSPPSERPGHVHDPRTAAAYAATRAPATFAAAGKAMLEGARRLPDFAPRTLLDLGAGTGAAAWAAHGIWPSLADLTLVDREASMVALGRRLAAGEDSSSPLATAAWQTAPIAGARLDPVDLVSIAYVLGELPAAQMTALIESAWAATRGALVIVEPGSPAGFARILAARSILIASGAAIAAPCPGTLPCPVAGADWCHFLVRLERSRLHQRTKAATLAWEDEPFSYVIASRLPAEPAPRVVLGRPRHRPGRVELRVCAPDGAIVERTLSRRDGRAFRAAKDLAWGDRLPAEVADRLGLGDAGGPPGDG
jgi:ribosomal protein RSM22 (predicted rRNA methylase)